MNTQEIINNILESKKYRSIHPPTVSRIVTEAAERYPEKKVEKQARKRLHQLVTTYFTRPNYGKLRAEINARLEGVGKNNSGTAPEAICQDLLSLQTSTRERIPDYSTFYRDIWEITGKPHSIVDYGCGVNPFSYYWIQGNIRYTGCDIDCELNAFIREIMTLLGFNENVTIADHDILIDKPLESDLALFLKVAPLLEGQTLPVLKQTPAQHLVVSFPTRTIGGRNVGMKEHYTRQFTDLIRNEPWSTTTIEYDNEIVFIITK